MASIKILLRTSKINLQGEAPLCIRITKNRTSKFVFLDYRIKPEFWNEEEKCVRKSHPNAARINNYILQKLSEASAQAMKMETEKNFVSPTSLKETIKGKSAVEFFPYADRFAASFEATGKIGTHRRAKSVINKLRDYVKGRKLFFDNITVTFLREYEYYLLSKVDAEKKKKKNKVNTVHANFRLLRTIFNNAVREDLIPVEINPFNKIKLKSEQTQRAYLTEEELNKIDELHLEESYMINHHRNIYIFAAWTGGLRISDILQLRWKNFDGEKITIKIHKTQTPLSIKLPERALQIVNSYRKENCNGNDFIFPLLKICPDEKNPETIHCAISSASAYTNKNLYKIAELAGIEKHISFHTSRHTWATRALTKGMRIEHVSKLMGHAAIKETQIYAKIVNAELDKAMAVFN
jgi:integrase/recombinase XerD